VNLHLFSTPGNSDLGDIVEAGRPYLEGRDNPRIAYLPVASLSNTWSDQAKKAFRGLGKVKTINTETMDLPEMEEILREASLVYISGGNTFLLNHRLHISGLMGYLRQKIRAGMPLVAFSAGAVICGPNILTSNDLNSVGTTHFSGLNVTPFNFNAHYPQDTLVRQVRDDWLSDYHVFHDNPVLILCDGAYLRVEARTTTLVKGEGYILRKGEEKESLPLGKSIIVKSKI
jgi:dipeptidase E